MTREQLQHLPLLIPSRVFLSVAGLTRQDLRALVKAGTVRRFQRPAKEWSRRHFSTKGQYLYYREDLEKVVTPAACKTLPTVGSSAS